MFTFDFTGSFATLPVETFTDSSNFLMASASTDDVEINPGEVKPPPQQK